MNNIVVTNPTADTRLIVVMGVSGSGKTSLAIALGEHYGFRYIDADDFHSESNRARMASGQPLTDEMRAPWVQALQEHLRQEAAQVRHCTLAFSGLKKAHRDKIRAAGLKTLFVFLNGDKEVIQSRLQQRANHFMAPGLLDSQFESLEPPVTEHDVVRIDVADSFEKVVAQTVEAIDRIQGWQ